MDYRNIQDFEQIRLIQTFDEAVKYREQKEDSKAKDLFLKVFKHVDTSSNMRIRSGLYLAHMLFTGDNGVEQNWPEAMNICKLCDQEFLDKQYVDETTESKIHLIMAHIFNYGCSAIPQSPKEAMFYFDKIILNCKINKTVAEDAKISKAGILINSAQSDKIKLMEAEELIDQVLQNPSKREIEAKFMKALILSLTQRFPEAYTIYESIISSPIADTLEKTRAELNLAEFIIDTYCFQNHLEKAVSLLESITKKTLNAPAIKFFKGAAYNILGNIPQALSFLFYAYVEGDKAIKIQSESLINNLYKLENLKNITKPYLLLIEEVKNQEITKHEKWEADSLNGNSEITDLLKTMLLLDEDCQEMVHLKKNILIYLTSNKYDFSSISSNEQNIIDAFGRLCIDAARDCLSRDWKILAYGLLIQCPKKSASYHDSLNKIDFLSKIVKFTEDNPIDLQNQTDAEEDPDDKDTFTIKPLNKKTKF